MLRSSQNPAPYQQIGLYVAILDFDKNVDAAPTGAQPQRYQLRVVPCFGDDPTEHWPRHYGLEHHLVLFERWGTPGLPFSFGGPAVSAREANNYPLVLVSGIEFRQNTYEGNKLVCSAVSATRDGLKASEESRYANRACLECPHVTYDCRAHVDFRGTLPEYGDLPVNARFRFFPEDSEKMVNAIQDEISATGTALIATWSEWVDAQQTRSEIRVAKIQKEVLENVTEGESEIVNWIKGEGEAWSYYDQIREAERTEFRNNVESLNWEAPAAEVFKDELDSFVEFVDKWPYRFPFELTYEGDTVMVRDRVPYRTGETLVDV